MAGVKLHITAQDKQFRAALQRLERATRDLTPAFNDIGEYLIQSVEERFNSQHDPTGTAWTPLAASTLKKKRHRKILTESTDLRGSQTYQADADELAFGTVKIYGAIHQLGGKAGRGRRVEIPARPYLGLNDEDEDEIGKILVDHLAEALKR